MKDGMRVVERAAEDGTCAGTRSPPLDRHYLARASGKNEDFGIITPTSRNLVRQSADLSLCHHSLDLATYSLLMSNFYLFC